MRSWQTLIVVVSAAAALAVGLGAQANPLPDDGALLALLQSVTHS
jgi:hypothetical protein